jgi:hypothetical protein
LLVQLPTAEQDCHVREGCTSGVSVPTCWPYAPTRNKNERRAAALNIMSEDRREDESEVTNGKMGIKSDQMELVIYGIMCG